MTTRKASVEAMRERFRSAVFGDWIKVLDEFVALTGHHRKAAIRVLREEVATANAVPTRNPLCEAVRQALTLLRDAADRVCGKRLKALIPMRVVAIERHGHLGLDPVIKTPVQQISAAEHRRALAAARLHIDGQHHTRVWTQPFAAASRREPMRSRACKKNDQAWVAQKNDAVARRRRWAPERYRCDEGLGGVARVIAPPHQLLPAFVQAEVQAAGRRPRSPGLLHSSDAARSASGARPHRAGTRGEAERAVQRPRPPAAAATDPACPADVGGGKPVASTRESPAAELWRHPGT